MKAFYSDRFVLPLPEGHRFPMSKYRLLREQVVERRLIDELEEAPAIEAEQLLLVHSPSYWQRVRDGALDQKEVRAMGFPWSPQLVERSRRSVGATLAAARVALERGVAVNLAGGTHHAFADRGSGFCVFNDVAVAARTLCSEGAISRALVIDTDVHQGDGTAAIFSDDRQVFTLSIHGRKNFPFRKEVSDLDVPLEDGTGDIEYLARLDDALDEAFERSGDGGRLDLVFHLAGADAYEGDKLGRLSLSQAGLRERDRRIYEICHRKELPVAVVMGGGYCPAIDETVAIHAATVEEARRLAR